MNKHRPLNGDCKGCGGIVTVVAGYRHSGSYIITGGRKKLDTEGRWNISCIKGVYDEG